MKTNRQIARMLFGLGMLSLGLLTLRYGYGVLLFRVPPPGWVAWLKVVGYVSGAIMIVSGAGLLAERSAHVATFVLLPFLLLWTLSRVPVIVSDPGREISWFAVAEIAVLAAAALVLYAQVVVARRGLLFERVAHEHGLLTARFVFGLALLTFGLSHFFEFAAHTVSLVPAWLPYRAGWADLTGAAQVAAGLGVLLSIYPRRAAAIEAAMLSLFALVVWVPIVIARPTTPSNWGELLYTVALAGAAWVITESIPARPASVAVTDAESRATRVENV